MGNNITIKKFQTARLDEWIGDYESAELIYEEIQKSEDKLAYILEKTITIRKNKLPDEKLMGNNFDEDGIFYKKEIDNITKRLYQPESLKPLKKLRTHVQYDSPKWKYSVSVMSKADHDLRLEIRGYNPHGNLPKLNTKLPNEILNWLIKSNNVQLSGDEVILFEIDAFNEAENTMMYLAIDYWGLLCGTVIVDEKCLGDTLSSIDMFLSDLSNKIW